ncbi:hypothetical protein D7X30_04155 [Corallococcus sp. AB011P]|uniref:hypothetical protein n=1 Tax=Corallococcus sp. AB011P TaxID=2316735 RepID=UPI000EA2B900|nr:hypothetical protein [Corallococcus sp. AB011P]RKG62487.1 hypothetical protein D7X30_04155 [Corallococcus sp. AB011P]
MGIRHAIQCLGVPLLLALGACSPSYVQRTAQVRVLAESARYTEARKELAAEADRSSLDALLVAVDDGALLHRAGEWEQSARVLNEAAALADARETVSLSQELFGSAPWRMGTLERQTLHALNALNQLKLGRPEAAAVEARLTNALHLRQHLEALHQTELERSLAFVPFDEDFRAYLERLSIGLYVSALAHELAGNEDSAFIDYLEAWRITRGTPPGAPSSLTHLLPRLVAEARRLGRPELLELEPLLVERPPEPVSPDPGELVVVVEAGWIPERCLVPRSGTQVWSVCTRSWSHAKARVEVAGRSQVAETVTSMENLLIRRGALGAMADTERAPSLAVNLGAAASYVLVPPLGAALIIRRVVEVNTRMAQGWLSLPAEFQVARLSLPQGRQTVTLHMGTREQVHEVDIRPGRPQVLVVQME